MIEIRTYRNAFLSKDKFKSLMQKVDKHFTPPVSEEIDLAVYSEKLYAHASFVVAEENKEVIGFTAFYLNIEAKQLYIPLICVDPNCQNHGIGGKMLETLAQMAADGFHSIGLEVKKTNDVAYRFYKKHGFVEQEDRGKKFLMLKRL